MPWGCCEIRLDVFICLLLEGLVWMELFEVVCKMLLFIVIMLNILVETVFHSWPAELHARFCAPSTPVRWCCTKFMFIPIMLYHIIWYSMIVGIKNDKDRSSIVGGRIAPR